MWARYKANGTSLRNITFLAEQRVFVHNLNDEPANNAPEVMSDEKYKWNFEGMVTGDEVDTSDICGRL